MPVLTLPVTPLPAAPYLSGTSGGSTTPKRQVYISGSLVDHRALDGDDLFVLAGTLSAESALGQQVTASLVVWDEAGAHHYDQGEPVTIYDDTGSVAFFGFITDATETQPGQGPGLLHSIQCGDPHYLAEKRRAAVSYTNQTCGYIVGQLVTNILSAEGVTAGTVQAGVTPPSFTSNYATVAECLDALASASGYFWQIDANKVLTFAAPGLNTGPAITVDTYERGSCSVKRANPSYRNRQLILGIPAETSSQTETRQGDGKATTFTMSYPFAHVPTVSVNSVSKTVGIKGVDTGKDWYWSKGDAVLAQDSAGTKLISTDTLSVVYIGQYTAIVQSDDGGQQSAQQTREGGGTSGIVEDVQSGAALTSVGAAFQVAAGYLQKYSQLGRQLTFKTTKTGFAAGQLCTTTIPAHDFSGDTLLIESVRMGDDDGLNLWYEVKAVEGPFNNNWQQFWQSLIARTSPTADAINIGASATLVTQVSFPAAAAPTATFTATVYACFVFDVTFPKTFC